MTMEQRFHQINMTFLSSDDDDELVALSEEQEEQSESEHSGVLVLKYCREENIPTLL